jgi:septum formation protein
MNTWPRLILASASPRRKRLLSDAGFLFEVQPSSVDETRRDGENPLGYARRMAEEKAIAVNRTDPDGWIIAADTVVTIEGWVLGKPADESEAVSILERLAGRTHQVITAFCIIHDDILRVDHCITDVVFRSLSLEDIRHYIQSGEIWDKAGAYGIQGMGAFLTERMNGSYTNVIGLPLAEVIRALGDLGFKRP